MKSIAVAVAAAFFAKFAKLIIVGVVAFGAGIVKWWKGRSKTLLLLFSAGKLGKVLLTGGTMVLSIVAYSWIFGWWYAVGFVALILAHEMGHYIAARQCRPRCRDG